MAVERRGGFPVRTRYELTHAGRILRTPLVELRATGEESLRLTRSEPRDGSRAPSHCGHGIGRLVP